MADVSVAELLRQARRLPATEPVARVLWRQRRSGAVESLLPGRRRLTGAALRTAIVASSMVVGAATLNEGLQGDGDSAPANPGNEAVQAAPNPGTAAAGPPAGALAPSTGLPGVFGVRGDGILPVAATHPNGPSATTPAAIRPTAPGAVPAPVPPRQPSTPPPGGSGGPGGGSGGGGKAPAPPPSSSSPTNVVDQTLAPVVAPVYETVGPVVSPVTTAVEPVLEPVQPVLEPVGQSVRTLVEPVEETAGPALTMLGPALPLDLAEETAEGSGAAEETAEATSAEGDAGSESTPDPTD